MACRDVSGRGGDDMIDAIIRFCIKQNLEVGAAKRMADAYRDDTELWDRKTLWELYDASKERA